jgi:membrane protease YdiL (CAAX protease family)
MALFYIYGLAIISYFEEEFQGIEITPFAIIASLTINVIVMCGAAITCTMLLNDVGLKGALNRLRFRLKNIPMNVIFGIVSAIIFIGLMIAIFSLLVFAGYRPPENLLVEKIVKAMSLPLLFAVPLLSSISEETFFRGFLQSKIGLIPTSILFGMAHLSYHNILQVIVPTAFGILLGILLIKTKNLLAPISAHFAFDFIQLSMGMFLS